MGVSGITTNLMDGLSDLSLRGKNAKDLTGEASVGALAGNAALAIPNPVAGIQEQAGSLAKDFQNYSGQSGNMLARNFATAPEEDSRYLKAALDSFRVEQQVQRSQTAAITAFLASYGIDASEYASPAGASMAMRRKSNKESLEANQKNLDELQENIEQNTEEAMAPKDAEGNPIPGATGVGAGVAPLPDPAPEHAGAGDVAAANVEAAAVPEAAAPEIASAPAARVSIDIIM